MFKTPRTIGILAIIGNVLIWGAALPVVKPALTFISPYYFLWARYAVASLFMVPVGILTFPKTHRKSILIKTLTLEFLQTAIGLSLLYQGLNLTTALEGALITTTSPLLITLGGILFLRERQEKNEWFGLGISLLGSLIVVAAPFLSGSHSHGNLLGNAYIVLYVISWAAYVLLSKKQYAVIDKRFIAAIDSLTGFVAFTFLAPLLSQSLPTPDVFLLPAVLTPILYMGILGTPVAVGLYVFGQSKIEASEATLFTYLQPLVYLPLTLFWLKEPIHPYQIIGLVFILAGVILAQLRQKPTSVKKRRLYKIS